MIGKTIRPSMPFLHPKSRSWQLQYILSVLTAMHRDRHDYCKLENTIKFLYEKNTRFTGRDLLWIMIIDQNYTVKVCIEIQFCKPDV